MKKIYRVLAILPLLLLTNLQLKAQIVLHQTVKISQVDSLYNEFSNIVYRAFYNLNYMMTQTASFTILKIDINNEGYVDNIAFSDSADPSLLKAWEDKSKTHNEKNTIYQYAKLKGYKNMSLIVPVSFEPNAPNAQKQFSYDQVESVFKFNKANFIGNSVILPPIFIPVLKDHNR